MFTCKRMNLDLYVTLYITINEKLIQNLNIRAKTIKHSEGNIDVNVNLRLGNDFPYMTKSTRNKRNNHRQFGIIKMKPFSLQMMLSKK